MRDKFLTEAMGECWHEPYPETGYTCKKCDESGYLNRLHCEELRLDLSTWQGFGKLWEWAQQQEWWDKFLFEQESSYLSDSLGYPETYAMRWMGENLVNPDRFADAVYEYLKERE